MLSGWVARQGLCLDPVQGVGTNPGTTLVGLRGSPRWCWSPMPGGFVVLHVSLGAGERANRQHWFEMLEMRATG